MFRLLAVFALVAALAYAPLARALPANANAAQDYLLFSAGIFNVLHDDSDTAGQIGAEYRFREWDFGIRPTLGVLANWNGGLYGYGGLNWEVPLIANRLFLTPGIMIGAYSQGNGKDLGGPIEFRESIELAYQFDNAQRLGLAFTHMSNASIYDHNPGVEALLLEYSLPVSMLGR